MIKDDLEVRLDLDDDVTDDKQMEVTTDIIFFQVLQFKVLPVSFLKKIQE